MGYLVGGMGYYNVNAPPCNLIIVFLKRSLSNDRNAINISQEIGFRDDAEELSIDALIGELDGLMKGMCEDYQQNELFEMR